MKKNRKSFDGVSRFALTVLVALIIFAVFTNSFIMVSDTLRDAGFPKSGTLGMLFDYGATSGHKMKIAGQILSNLVAYIFMLAAIIIFVLSLKLIKHDKVVKAKCAILGLALFVPATIGLVGGVVNFFGQGFRFLNNTKGLEPSLIMGCYIVTLILDVAFLVLAVISLVLGIGTAVKVNKGEVIYEAVPEKPVQARGETLEEKAAREEKEAAERVELLNNIRQIVKEELNKLDRVAIVSNIAVAPAPEKKAEPAPEPVDDKLSIKRIPFAEKIVKADKELQQRYNEIKSEILAYGASSRVSIAGDTFRLHRKPYAKITIVGKTLKVYFALNPRDFVDSPIPIIDESDKTSYEEVPALLKVKSNLACKRAKDLTEMAFAVDGVKKENDPVEHNWVKDIKAELKAKK